jgi:hypothetical protein
MISYTKKRKSVEKWNHSTINFPEQSHTSAGGTQNCCATPSTVQDWMTVNVVSLIRGEM